MITITYLYYVVFSNCIFIVISYFFFFNDTATTEIYTLSLHDALPIWSETWNLFYLENSSATGGTVSWRNVGRPDIDRKSTRLNSSHANISYAVFCLKKKKKKT